MCITLYTCKHVVDAGCLPLFFLWIICVKLVYLFFLQYFGNMELAHSLLLNEEAFKKIPENKRPVFVFEWLRFLDKVLSAAQKVCVLSLFIITYQVINHEKEVIYFLLISN